MIHTSYLEVELAIELRCKKCGLVKNLKAFCIDMMKNYKAEAVLSKAMM